ncbi:MAG: UDP-N-acetylmuramate-alanine ligase/UDP-N-acetylenolpyruvoylglucosamine reductase [Verrucomicrobia bacterium]|nr:MAG: UDP-N-acetylmuramate-alanine ligase/UDP-N-acetylenolpyruvoylglucosamine reductase [Verrucomicrobiota bacterium]
MSVTLDLNSVPVGNEPAALGSWLGSGVRSIHLIGVAGSGMSGIAALLLSLGHRVSGSDKVTTVEVDRLCSVGLAFYSPSQPQAVLEADLVVYSSAIRAGHPDYAAAKESEKPMVRRAEALAALLACRRGIVVAGMHGKTTTSAMAAHVLRAGGLHPSHYVGAEIPVLGVNAHWDAEGEWFVAEGDESDGTLALYQPEHAIVLNVEAEHLDFYKDLDAIDVVFRRLLAQTRGIVFYSADDAHATRLCEGHPGAISYGETEGAVYRFDDLHLKAFQSHFRVLRNGVPLGAVTLNIPGKHNASNAVSVVALACELGIPFATSAKALDSFRGARRRFEIKYRSARYMVVDDYGHHPTEVKATLAAVRNAGSGRVLVLFQPHRFSRTAALKEDFGRAFGDAAEVWVTGIYAASETPLEGISGNSIVEEILKQGHTGARYQPDRAQMLLEVGRILQPGDCVVTLGAGNIHEQAKHLAQDLAVLEALQQVMGAGAARLYESLAKHTTLRIGGPAQYWLEPETEEGFARLVHHCTEQALPLFVIGRGSNLLVRDGGIRGVVVYLGRGEFRRLEVRENRITAGVGVRQKELALAARDAGIGGFEWFEGIPGNVGGALRMNAGAMGSDTFSQVVSLRYVDAAGEFHTRTPEECEVLYRSVPFLRENFAVSATFFGTVASPEEIEAKLENSMQKRKGSQPRESSAGCIFKNPAGTPAGRLIEELGLKGAREGGARVSEVHGNFLVNDRHASAEEMLALIERVKEEAWKARGIRLETEVQIVGEQKGLYA